MEVPNIKGKTLLKGSEEKGWRERAEMGPNLGALQRYP